MSTKRERSAGTVMRKKAYLQQGLKGTVMRIKAYLQQGCKGNIESMQGKRIEKIESVQEKRIKQKSVVNALLFVVL